jgi:hypothetical protein
MAHWLIIVFYLLAAVAPILAGEAADLSHQADPEACSGDATETVDPCGGRQSTDDDIFGFFGEVAAGRKTRTEIEIHTDWLLTDLEHACTPGMAANSEVFEKLQTFTWQVLHDGPRLLRTTELRIEAIRSNMRSGDIAAKDEIKLLAERVRVLTAYNLRTVLHGQQWPPPINLPGDADGELPYPPSGCGDYPKAPINQATRSEYRSRREHGGWLKNSKAAERWGGGGVCTIRVIGVEEWAKATPKCLAALFQRPFLVRGGGDRALNHTHFSRDNLAEVAAEAKMKTSYLNTKSSDDTG